VDAEGDRARKEDGEAGDDRQGLVPARALENEVMGALVDQGPEAVVGDGADDPGGEEELPEWPAGDQGRDRDLQAHDREDPEGRRRGVSEELLELGMSREDLLRAPEMGLRVADLNKSRF